jgi:hypothetical protein
MPACNWPAVEAMFAPGFQSVHADGVRDGDEEIRAIQTSYMVLFATSPSNLTS